MGDEDQKTPLMEQYERIKSEHQDEILFFRLGDFYEMFNDDARVASRELEVTLTTKPVGKDTEVPMAGVPIHSYEEYLHKLIQNGHRVAICEQVEDASASKGIVKREVTRVVTPGTLTEEDFLDRRKNNFLAAFCVNSADEGGGTVPRVGLAYVDLSTGEFEASEFDDKTDHNILGSEINRLHPAEVVFPGDERHRTLVEELTQYREHLARTARPPWHFEEEEARRELAQQFEEDLPGETTERPMLIRAAGALINYLGETQKQALAHLNQVRPYEREQFMVLDATSQRNLELVESLTGQESATLLNVLDDTETAMGSRRLRKWILQPLVDQTTITDRLDAVEWFVENGPEIESIKETLTRVYDIQRIVGKIGSSRANPKDLKSLGQSLDQIPEILTLLPDQGLFERLKNRLDPLDELRQEFHRALVDNPPGKITEGEIFADGYDDRLDELRNAMRNGRDWIAQLQKEERERTGIDSLKVGHNKVHGYYIEVTKANIDRVPDNYERKQTLTNSERYITPELKEKEQVILGAEEKSKALEEELFRDLRSRTVQDLETLKENADVLAELDVLSGLSMISRRRGYVRPSVNWDNELDIEQGRHPVVEEIHEEEFVPNDLTLDEERRIVVLTGPNMSGKSTYIRQVALISIMAQMGCFVPADRARVGMIDQVFTRVGARDFLAGGQSTFMVEMVETAEIVNNATDRSLLILDEVGRGTSTHDGLAIARAVIEHIAREIGARTLFATHYHELTDLARESDSVFNMTVRAREWEDEVVFLRQVEEGQADRSYGIEVAKLAGLPQPLIDRARAILRNLEDQQALNGQAGPPSANGSSQMDLFHPARPVLERLRSLSLENTTPVEALNVLKSLQDRLQELDEVDPS